MFFNKGMTVNDLKKIVDKAVVEGYGDALIQVQADADGISDIMINGFEGYGQEFGDGEKVFSLVSAEDETHFRNCYGGVVEEA